MVSKLREGALSPTGRKFADTVHSKIEELRKELFTRGSKGKRFYVSYYCW